MQEIAVYFYLFVYYTYYSILFSFFFLLQLYFEIYIPKYKDYLNTRKQLNGENTSGFLLKVFSWETSMYQTNSKTKFYFSNLNWKLDKKKKLTFFS